MLLILLTAALCPTLRATVWQKQCREVRLLKLVRYLQAGADQPLPLRFALALVGVFVAHTNTGVRVAGAVAREVLRRVPRP